MAANDNSSVNLLPTFKERDMNPKTQLCGKLAAGAAALMFGSLLAAGPAFSQQVNGVLGSPTATTTIDGKQLPPPQRPGFGVDAVVGSPDRPAQGRAQRAAHHDGRRWL
jgi:hypothetical protein